MRRAWSIPQMGLVVLLCCAAFTQAATPDTLSAESLQNALPSARDAHTLGGPQLHGFRSSSLAVLQETGEKALVYVFATIILVEVTNSTGGRHVAQLATYSPGVDRANPSVAATAFGFFATWEETNNTLAAIKGTFFSGSFGWDVPEFAISLDMTSNNTDPSVVTNSMGPSAETNDLAVTWTKTDLSTKRSVSALQHVMVQRRTYSLVGANNVTSSAISNSGSCRSCGITMRYVSGIPTDYYAAIACETGDAKVDEMHTFIRTPTGGDVVVSEGINIPAGACPAINGILDAVLYGFFKADGSGYEEVQLQCSNSTEVRATGCSSVHAFSLPVSTDLHQIAMSRLRSGQLGVSWVNQDRSTTLTAMLRSVFFTPSATPNPQHWGWTTEDKVQRFVNVTSQILVSTAPLQGGGMELCYPDTEFHSTTYDCLTVFSANNTSPEPLPPVTPSPPQGAPRVLNSTSAGTSLGDGGYAVAYILDQAQEDTTVYVNVYSRLAAGGVSHLAGQYKLNSVADPSPARPSIAQLVFGGFVVSWDVVNPATGLREVRTQIGTTDGHITQKGSISAPGANQSHAEVCGLGDGQYAVAWNSGEDVLLRIGNSTTHTYVSEAKTDARLRGITCQGQTVTVLYLTYTPDNNERTSLQYAQYVVPEKAPAAVFTFGVMVHRYTIYDAYFAASISAFANGDVVIAWEAIYLDVEGTRIQKYTSSGAPLMGYGRVLRAFSRNPKVAAIQDGFFVLVFNSGLVGDEKWELVSMLFNASHSVVDVTNLASVTSANQWFAFDLFVTRWNGAVSNIVVAYADEKRDGTSSDIFFRSESFDHTAAPPTAPPLPATGVPGVQATPAPVTAIPDDVLHTTLAPLSPPTGLPATAPPEVVHSHSGLSTIALVAMALGGVALLLAGVLAGHCFGSQRKSFSAPMMEEEMGNGYIPPGAPVLGKDVDIAPLGSTNYNEEVKDVPLLL